MCSLQIILSLASTTRCLSGSLKTRMSRFTLLTACFIGFASRWCRCGPFGRSARLGLGPRGFGLTSKMMFGLPGSLGSACLGSWIMLISWLPGLLFCAAMWKMFFQLVPKHRIESWATFQSISHPHVITKTLQSISVSQPFHKRRLFSKCPKPLCCYIRFLLDSKFGNLVFRK